ncbi:patched-related protein [Chloropicon primus]|uniref:Patched-related protein n=1 Tax=Chloropicon primus TaxID=1764295 RepID=A0A5B8MJH8_9CHLO|nr:patched-related protein [Chloropicon primus]UPQ99780.1 patched-related protein [Chloropicon primus]|eukprot:QDZ20569.1 patched-related protein [Chloropicon primus]
MISPTRILTRYSYWAHKRPVKILLIEFFILSMICSVVFGAGYFQFSRAQSGREWLIKGEKTTSRRDAVDESIMELESARDGSALERSSQLGRFNVFFSYRSVAGNVFTPENLAVMHEVESIVTGYKTREDYCLLRYSETGDSLGCQPAYSPASAVFDPQGQLVSNWTEVIREKAQNKKDHGYFFSTDFDPVQVKAGHTRSIVFSGLPLQGFVNKDDRGNEQGDKIIRNYLVKAGNQIHNYLGTKQTLFWGKYMDSKNRIKGDLEVLWWGFGLQQELFSEAAMQDFFWAAFSFVSVGIYMGIHTKSAFIALIGMLEISFTIWLAFFFYRVVLQITYFTGIHFLAAFLLLGIGADDVFVFVDAFKQSEHMSSISHSLLKRLEYTSLRASKAVLITSLTTTVAFLATTSSRVMPISTFGIYASLCIFLLYWVNVIIMPPTLVIWDRLRKRGKTKDVENEMEAIPADDGALKKDDGGTAESGVEGDIDVQQLRWIEKYFHGFHTNMIKKYAYPILLVFGGVVIAGIYLCTLLQPPLEEENYFPKKHMFSAFRNIMDLNSGKSPYGTSSQDYVASVNVAWGLEGMSLKGTDKWNPEDLGKVTYDEEFDMSSPEAQVHVYNVCQDVKRAECFVEACENGTLVRYGEARCFIEGFKDWRESEGEAFPVTKEDFLPELNRWMQLQSTMIKYRDQVGLYMDHNGGLNLKFVSLEFNSTFTPPKSQKRTADVYRVWEDLMAEGNAAAPAGVDNAFQSTDFAWTWMITQVELVEGVKLGVTLVMVIAFVVINLSTLNVIVSIGAILAIGGIVTTTMGFGVELLMSYPLGVAESIATVILIGFSMDYCLHLAGAYVASKKATREERTRESLTEMGVSVTAGALTTVFSAVFLFGTVLTFFQKFAFIIIFTIGGSWLWSTIFFSTFCMVFGPEGNVGEWLHILGHIKGTETSAKVDADAKQEEADP